MKMKIFVLLFLVVGVFQMSLFSLITSRVEGTVVDEVTGQPIPGAEVHLIKCDWRDMGSIWCNLVRVGTTDIKGTFKIDNLKSGEYFLQLFKDGYAIFGPLLYLENPKDEETPWADPLSFSGVQFDEAEIKCFFLKEGEIKHFKIKLAKEAILKINISQKLPNKESEPFKGSGSCIVKHHKYVGDKFYSCGSAFTMGRYKAGKVDIRISASGYPVKMYENIILEKGKTTTIDYLLDFSRGQVIHGFVREKETGVPIEVSYIYLAQPDTKESVVTTITDKNGEYWLGGFEPGSYIMQIRSYYGDLYKTVVTIKANQKIEVNKDF